MKIASKILYSLFRTDYGKSVAFLNLQTLSLQ